MNKEWLIRTKNNHILGPVSLKKVKELLEKGSLKAEDELSCGNGYWFFIREEELVEKYITNEQPQGFNPVAEADSVLTKPVEEEIEAEEIKIPEDDDLEYPSLEAEENESNAKEAILESLKEEIESSEEPLLSLSEDKPDTIKVTKKAKLEPVDIDEVQTKTLPKKSFLNQNLLFLILFILLALAIVGGYYRKRIVKQLIEASYHQFISPVHAQVIPDSVKKKLII